MSWRALEVLGSLGAVSALVLRTCSTISTICVSFRNILRTGADGTLSSGRGSPVIVAATVCRYMQYFLSCHQQPCYFRRLETQAPADFDGFALKKGSDS